MIRLLHCVILISLFCWQWPPRAALAQAPCQELLPHGLYTGTANAVVDYTYRHVAESPPTRAVINDTGQIALTVGCTVTSGTNFWTWHRNIISPNGNTIGVGAMLGAGRLFVEDNGARLLLWPDGTAQGQDVWQTRFDPVTQRWNEPTPLFGDSVQRRALSAAVQPDGTMALGLVATPVLSETIAFAGGGTATVPTVGDTARLLVAQIPAGFTPQPPQGEAMVFLPIVTRE